MAACDVQDLIDANPCLVQLTPHQLNTVIVQMLCNLKVYLTDGGDQPSCDIQTVLDDAVCFQNLTDPMLRVLTAQLLCDISQLV